MTRGVVRPEGALRNALRRIGRRAKALADVRAVGWGLCVALAIAVLVAWLDLAVELSRGVRTGALWAGGALFVGAVIYVIVNAWPSARPERIARGIDSAGETGGQVLVGLELSEGGEAALPLTEGLRRIAVERAGGLAGQVAPPRVVPLRASARPFVIFVIGAACVGAVALAAPRLARTQAVRTLTPWVDQPPYSPYEFVVDPGDVKALYNQTVDVSVRFGEKKPDQLEMLVVPERGKPEVMPLFAQNDGAWRGQLRDLVVPVTYTVRAPQGRTRAYRVDLIYTPKITKVLFKVTPPAYTGLPAREGGLPEKGLSGLPGTIIECTIESNRVLSGGDMNVAWKDDKPESVKLMPVPGAPQSARGAFAIRGDAKVDIGIIDTTGLCCQSRISAGVTRTEDKRPFVRIADPPEQSYATPDAVLPVVVEADDDFGLSAMWLYRSLNDSRDLPVELLKGKAMVRAQARVELPLAAYGLEPGDILTFYARAQDNDPNAKGAESDIVRVTIISQEEFDRLTRAKASLEDLMSKYESQRRAIEALRERMDHDVEALKKVDPDSAEPADKWYAEMMRKELKELGEALEKQAAAAKALASEEPLFDIDKEMSHNLDDLAKALSQAGEKSVQASRSIPAAEAAQQLEEARRMLGEGEKEYAENAVEPLETMARAYALIEDEAKFAELYIRQRELVRRINSMAAEKDLDTPEARVRMADLADEQARIQEELAGLVEDIRAHEMTCPDTEEFEKLKTTAREFADALEKSGVDGEMKDVGKSLSERKAADGARHAANAEAIMARFMAQCRSDQGMGQAAERTLEFQPKLSGMGDTVSQLLSSAGLGGMARQGMGQGQSGRGGYSTQAGTLGNVGLFGTAKSGRPSGGAGGSDQSGGAMSVSLSRREDLKGGEGGGDGQTETGGGLLQSVPPEYRQRVQDYFRRVADETSSGAVK